MPVLRSRRRLVALFLATVVLPSALLTLLTVRGMRQERELAEQRAVVEQARFLTQVRQALRAHLDRTATEALGASSARASATPAAPYADSSVRLIAPVSLGVVHRWPVRLLRGTQRERASFDARRGHRRTGARNRHGELPAEDGGAGER